MSAITVKLELFNLVQEIFNTYSDKDIYSAILLVESQRRETFYQEDERYQLLSRLRTVSVEEEASKHNPT